MTGSPTMEVVPLDAPMPYPPRQSAFTAIFWQELERGVFQTTQCESCGRMSFPPKPFCPHCWGRSIRWSVLSPQGTVYSATRIHASPQLFRAESPYLVCILDLQDGVRLATKLLGQASPADVIGRRAELVVQRYADGPLFAAQLLEP